MELGALNLARRPDSPKGGETKAKRDNVVAFPVSSPGEKSNPLSSMGRSDAGVRQ